MADKIGSLVVSLQADIARFDSDLKRATSLAEGAMTKIQSSISSAMSAFGALGVGLSVAGFAAMAKQVVDSAAALDDLAEKTGASVESLSKFAGVARITGQDMGTVEQAMGKLSKSIVEAQNGSSDAARAFQAFGLSIKNSDGSLKNSGDLMAELAIKQQQFGDGAGKAAAFMQLLGKSGSEVIPFMNDYVRLSGEVSETTAEQAAQAESLKIEIGLLSEQFNKLVRDSILPLVPQLRGLIADFVSLGKAISEAIPSGNPFAGFLDDLRDTTMRTVGEIAYMSKVWENFKALMKNPLSGLGQSLTSYLTAGASAAYDAAYLAEQNKALARSVGDLPPLMEAAAASTNKAGVAFTKAGAGATKAADSFKAFKAAIMGVYQNALAAAEAEQEIAKAQEAIAKATRDGYTAMANSVGAADDLIRSYEEQTDAIGKTKEALAELEIQRAAEIRDMRLMAGMGDDAVALYDKQVAAIRRRLAVQTSEDAKQSAQSIADEFTQQSDSITQSLTDALLRGFESGKDFAENFVATLKNMFSTLILRPIIDAIVRPVGNAMAGLFGGGGGILGGGAGGGLDLAGLLGGGGSSLLGYGGLSGLFSGAGGIFGAGAIGNSFALGSMGQALGLSAAGLDMAGGVALTGLGSALGAALPIIGIAAMAYMMLKKPRGGQKEGGFAGDIPDIERFFTPKQRDSDVRQIFDATSDSFAQLMRSLGGTSTAQFAFGFDTDPKGTAQDRISAMARVNGQNVYSIRDFETGRDSEATAEALALAAKRALIAALQASDLPQDIANILNGIDSGTATTEAIDNVLGIASALGSLSEVFNGDVLQDGLDAYENSLRGINLALGDSIESVYELAADFDGTAEAATNLATATQGIYAAAVQAVGQINALRSQLSDLFQNSATNYRLAGMDDAGRRDYYQQRIAAATETLRSSTDVNQINELARQIDQFQQALFGLLSPEEQRGSAESFAQAAEAAGAIADDRLALALTSVDASITAMLTEVRAVFVAAGTTQQEAATAIAVAAASQQTAAATQLDAANIQLIRADIPLKIEVAYPSNEVGP